jgi:hypothetical protein
MRLPILILLPTILGTPQNRSPHQDGYPKTMTPYIFHREDAADVPLISQLEVTQAAREKRRGGGADGEVDAEEEEVGGSESKPKDVGIGRRWDERGLEWVQQAEYSGDTFFDG